MPIFEQKSVQTTPFFKRSSRMPSSRRVKLVGIAIFLFAITLLFWTASTRQQQGNNGGSMSEFYTKTVQGLERKPMRGSTQAEEEEKSRRLTERLKEAAQVAKDNANAKAPKPDPPSILVGVGSAAEGSERNIGGRKKYPVSGEEQQRIKQETQEEHEVEVELNIILKKSPIIIFSKSYCPHSRRAKTIFEKYIIDPAPFIVELDEHPLGPGLQAKLAERTGRRTVPNVLINAVSIGGGDDVAELDDNKDLINKIIQLGGNKILDVKAKPAPVEDEGHGLR